MRFEIKYKNINGFTRKTRIRARSSEEAIKKFQNEHRGAKILNIYSEDKNVSGTRSKQKASLISSVSSLSGDEKKKLFKSILNVWIIIFSVGSIFVMGTIAFFMILEYSLDYETKHLMYSILLILGIALIVVLNILYFRWLKRKKHN